MHRRRFLSRLSIAIAPLLAGCTGDGDGATPSPTPTTTQSPTPTQTAEQSPTRTPTPTATPAAKPAQEKYPDYNWNKLDNASRVSATTINMEGFEFRPLVAIFPPGTELTVTNKDSASHTLTIPKLRIDEQVGGGASISITLNESGTFDYVCEFHPPGMLGRFVITTETPTPTPTDTPTQTATPTPTPTPDDDGGYY